MGKASYNLVFVNNLPSVLLFVMHDMKINLTRWRIKIGVLYFHYSVKTEPYLNLKMLSHDS